MNTVKTKLGTDLPLQNLKGKAYLLAAHRVLWFREEKPDYGIQTQIVFYDEKWAIFKAIISNEKGDIVAIAHKTEHAAHFGDYLEKAETGAIARALALCGFGTAFALELDDSDRISDAPLAPPQNIARSQTPAPARQATPPQVERLADPGEFEIPFGKKFIGKKLKDVPMSELSSFYLWLKDQAELSKPAKDTLISIERFLSRAKKL